MRISDWSSDVCSSDLEDFACTGPARRTGRDAPPAPAGHARPRGRGARGAGGVGGPGVRRQHAGTSGRRRQLRLLELPEERGGGNRRAARAVHGGLGPGHIDPRQGARKRVVWGKGVSVGVEFGGRGIRKKKKKQTGQEEKYN